MQTAIRLDRPVPHEAVADVEERRLPAKYANDRFVFVHYPYGWSWHAEHGFLPELSQIIAKPGVNGVGVDGRLNKAIAGAIQKGGTVINPEDARLGPWRRHVASYVTASGRKHYCFILQRYDILPGGRVVAKEDAAGYANFRAFIRDCGMIAPMEEAVYAQMIEIERRGYDRAATRGADRPHMVGFATARKERMAAMEAAWLSAANAPATGELSPAADDDLASEVADAMSAAGPVKRRAGRRVEVVGE
jgi:hypothetical protein